LALSCGVTLSPTISRTGSPILFFMENPIRLIISITKIAWEILLIINVNIQLINIFLNLKNLVSPIFQISIKI
jgi:hypothetical protein